LESDTGLFKAGDGVTALSGLAHLPGGGGDTSGLLPIADPTGVTIETADNPITGSGTIDVLTFPADTPVLAVKLEGDAFPRLIINVDPGDYTAIALGDGTVDPLGDDGAHIGINNDSGDPANDTDLVLEARVGNKIEMSSPVLFAGVATFPAGVVIVDQSDGHTYSIISTAGVLSTVQVD
jgi:hypothetical protein